MFDSLGVIGVTRNARLYTMCVDRIHDYCIGFIICLDGDVYFVHLMSLSDLYYKAFKMLLIPTD